MLVEDLTQTILGTVTYQVANLPTTIQFTGLSAGVDLSYQIMDPNGCGNGYGFPPLTCSIKSSWDCESGVCSDPGTGLGVYSSLAACNNACVSQFICDGRVNNIGIVSNQRAFSF